MTVAKEDDQVDLELHLEMARGDGGAREEPREDHVDGYRPAVAHGAVRDLDVLNLRRLSGQPISVAARLDAHELQLDRLDGRRAFIDLHLPGSVYDACVGR